MAHDQTTKGRGAGIVRQYMSLPQESRAGPRERLPAQEPSGRQKPSPSNGRSRPLYPTDDFIPAGATGVQVSFVLPAYNEEANIGTVLRRTVAAAKRLCSAFEILVVDDGSTDATAGLVQSVSAREPSIKLVSHGTHKGYGQALRSGFGAAQMEFVFVTNADNRFDIDELELMLTWVERADVVAGFRRTRRDPLLRRLNVWGWNRLVRWFFYVPVRDIDCAFKLFRKSVLDDIVLQSRGAMMNTEIMVKLARNSCAIVEVGVSHFPRKYGKSRGAKLTVIGRALREAMAMYPHLSTFPLPPSPAPVSYETVGIHSGAVPGVRASAPAVGDDAVLTRDADDALSARELV